MRESYFRYSLAALIIIFGWLIFNGLWSFVNGFLGAFTIYVIVRRQMIRFTYVKHWKRIWAAVVIMLEVFACVIVPLSLLVWVLVDRVQQINIDVTQAVAAMKHFVSLIEEKTGYDLFSAGNIETAAGFLTRSVQIIVGQVSSLFVAAVVMLFVLYFMLISREEMERYVYSLLPFGEADKTAVMTKVRDMVYSNAIGIPLLAIIQGMVAVVGYYVFKTPTPVLFGVLTAFASIIPIVGTGIVWAPLAVYLALAGEWGMAAGLVAYSALILSNVDNLVRFLLQKKIADTHPLVTVFGVIVGLRYFGFWGIIFGPLLISMFFLFVDIFKKEYLDR